MTNLGSRLHRAAAPLVLLALACASANCASDSGIAGRLEDLLNEVADLGQPEATPDELRQALAHQLRVAPLSAKGPNRPSNPAFPTRETMREFYGGRGQRLAWSDDSGDLLPAAETVLRAIRSAGEHGLDPEEYEISRLERMRDELREGGRRTAGATRRADFDLLLTTAFFRYASDLSTGRVHPDEIRSEWHTRPPELDLPAALSRALQEGQMERLLESLPPPHEGYARLRDGLISLRRLEEAGGWEPIPLGPELRQGARGPRVALLRQRLMGSGGSGGSGHAGDLFDAQLEEAIRRFQRLHGLEPNGVVTKETLAELNVPLQGRIRQVELNLERWRWIPRRREGLFVEVNIPAFELQLLREGRPELRSRIVVGEAFTKTPVFTDRIVSVVANPPWNVPRTMAVREYLPELQKNPEAFLRRGIRIYESSGEEVDPGSVAWSRVSDDEFSYQLRQDPGEENALGRIKFDMTNRFQIYLHDTPARALFARSERDFSHGCIRVEKARELADRILGGSAGKLAQALDSERQEEIPLRPPVAVQILYQTAWVDPDGQLHFGPDIYDFDAPQRAALDRLSVAPRKS